VTETAVSDEVLDCGTNALTTQASKMRTIKPDRTYRFLRRCCAWGGGV
jgi:hypothetical protein